MNVPVVIAECVVEIDGAPMGQRSNVAMRTELANAGNTVDRTPKTWDKSIGSQNRNKRWTPRSSAKLHVRHRKDWMELHSNKLHTKRGCGKNSRINLARIGECGPHKKTANRCAAKGAHLGRFMRNVDGGCHVQSQCAEGNGMTSVGAESKAGAQSTHPAAEAPS